MKSKMFKKNRFKILELMPQKLWELEEVKNYLRISYAYDDKLIDNLIYAAITAAENFTKLSIAQKRVEYVCNIRYSKIFPLKYYPVAELVKATLLYNEQEIRLEQEQYYLDQERWFFCLKESISDKELTIEYIAGFNEREVPQSIKYGILLHVAQMYDREEHTSSSFSTEIRNLYLPYRQWKV
jgi:uncharacterized phiE125 gp8 family phage protein